MRNTASGLMARRCSTSIQPPADRYASLPCRATRARKPGNCPESTYDCSVGAMRCNPAVESPTSSGRARGRPCAMRESVRRQHDTTAKRRALTVGRGVIGLALEGGLAPVDSNHHSQIERGVERRGPRSTNLTQLPRARQLRTGFSRPKRWRARHVPCRSQTDHDRPVASAPHQGGLTLPRRNPKRGPARPRRRLALTVVSAAIVCACAHGGVSPIGTPVAERAAHSLAGRWDGEVRLPASPPYLMTITLDSAGGGGAVQAEGSEPVPFVSVTRVRDSVVLRLPAAGQSAVFRGRLSADGARLDGIIEAGGESATFRAARAGTADAAAFI